MASDHKLPEKPLFEEGSTVSIKQSSRIINNITFFGDAAIPEDSPIYHSVYDAAQQLAMNEYVIVDGGGPGLMKAATDGAESVNGKTVAVYWEPKLASFFEGKNLANVADETTSQSNYVIRTLGLIEKGDAYVVCKGGTGTISEFGLVWCLAKLYFGVHKPIILFGDFWPQLIESFKETMYIDEKELGVLYYATDPAEIGLIIEEHEKRLDLTKIKAVTGDEAGFILRPSAKQTINSYTKSAHLYHSDRANHVVAKDQLDEFMSLINAPANVLDIGTGPGYDAQYLSSKFKITGIEPVTRFAQIAQFENPNAEIINADFLSVNLPHSKFKGIWARDSIHHIHNDDLDIAFKKIYDTLVEEGIFYCIVRKGEGEVMELEKKAYGELERFYHLFTVEELCNRAERAGLELVKIDHIQRSHEWIIGVFKKPLKH